MKRRLLIIVLALILAAVGTSGVLSYVKQANAHALAGMTPVSVLVAQRKIPSGTTAGAAVREGLLASEKLPASAVPVNALSAVPGSLYSLAFSAEVEPGQLLLRPMLVQATQLTSGLAIPPGMMAVTITFCLSEVVAGAIHPGSQVAVFDTIASGGASQLSAQPGCAGAHQQSAGSIKTRIVLPRLLVLSVGAATGGTASGPATTAQNPGSSSSGSSASGSGTLVTMAVSQTDAERLIQLTEAGLPYLALLSPASRTTADAGNLLNIQPRGAASPAPSPVLTFPVVIPSPVPTQPAPSPAPSPSPSPTPSKKKHKKGK
jgi:pilus assembly protein CpaB